jgi:predicted dehydrogenase
MTRRTFLGSGPAALASGRKLRVGIVGGRFGASFQFHEHPNCTVAAVADLRPDRRDRLASTYSCPKAYASLDELLGDRTVEAVGLFTPAPDHVAHATAALKVGKHVLSAVPAAMTLEECARLIEAVERSGLTYMMAETSYYQQLTISARKFHQAGEFGRVYSCESEYHHSGLEELFFEDGKRTWRHGFPPMHYPTHCTAHLVSVTGERLTDVACLRWGDKDEILRTNRYGNPFWNETAFFKTDRGTAFRVAVFWKGAHRGTERAQYYGDKMSFFFNHPNGLGPVIVRMNGPRTALEKYETPRWWATEMLPAPLRHDSGHEGSHTFITHEFLSAVIENRRPTVDVYEAVAYTAPGIVAHQSALTGGSQLRIPAFDRKR